MSIRFLLVDSCISQLLSITHKICKSFDCNLSIDVGGTFLDISKAFDKVWHDGLIYKLKSYDVENKHLNLIQNYLTNRRQSVHLNGSTLIKMDKYSSRSTTRICFRSFVVFSLCKRFKVLMV